MNKRIAVIKTGWSDDYGASPVEADHDCVKINKDGHEKFNFLPAPDGRFYAFAPPRAPNPKDREDWLVFSVAKRPDRPGLYLTGWYECATFAGGYADPEHSEQVEKAAIAMAFKQYPQPKFEIADKQKDNCGYDLLVRSMKKSSPEMHIEVKGTQNAKPHFLMSKREYAYMRANPRQWRLAMACDALGKKPKLEIPNANEARQRFFWEEFTWHATSRP